MPTSPHRPRLPPYETGFGGVVERPEAQRPPAPAGTCPSGSWPRLRWALAWLRHRALVHGRWDVWPG